MPIPFAAILPAIAGVAKAGATGLGSLLASKGGQVAASTLASAAAKRLARPDDDRTGPITDGDLGDRKLFTAGNIQKVIGGLLSALSAGEETERPPQIIPPNRANSAPVNFPTLLGFSQRPSPVSSLLNRAISRRRF